MKRTMLLSILILCVVGTYVSAKTIDQEEQISLKGISRIRITDTGIKGVGVVINNLRVTINVFPESRKDVLVHLYGDTTANNRKCLPALETERSAGTLNIQLERCQGLKFFVVSRGEVTLDVHVPETYEKDLEVVSSSGRMNIGAFTLEELNAGISSGSIFVEDITAETAELQASSGDISVLSCSAGRLSMRSSSGRIEADALNSESGNLHASSGRIRVGSVTGNFFIKTTSGKVRLDEARGDMEIECSSGDVKIQKAAGDFTIKCSSGDVEVDFDGNNGSLAVDSSSGKILVAGLNGTAVLDSTSGRIDAEFFRLTGDSSFKASSGGITIILPQDQEFILDAKTSSGRIDIDFPITVEGRLDKEEVYGTVGSGGSIIEVKSSSGNIEVRSR